MMTSSALPPLSKGSLVGRYRVITACGGGELSELYAAQNLAEGRKVVIRLMRKSITGDSELEANFEASAERLESLKHENFAKCKGHGLLEDGRPYLIFEWLEGEKVDRPELAASAFASLGSDVSAIYSGFVASTGQISLVGGTNKVLGFDWAANTKLPITKTDRLAEWKGEVSEPSAEGSYKEIAGQLKDEFSSDKVATKLVAGTLIDDTYRVIKLIGQGGMGCVYEAEHTRLPQHVAIKIVGGNYSEDSLVRFRREADISSSLGHPNIVKVYDFNTLPDGTPYMVMEYLEGEELSSALKGGAFSIERGTAIVRALGSALSAVHDIGVVHRDLKPQNVFLRRLKAGGGTKEHAMVLDFGVSKEEKSDSALTVANAVVGTPRYMSPEQAKGQNEEVSALSDQFALGVLAYEMLAGRPAFTRGDISEVIYRVCHVDPPTLASLNSSFPLYLSAAVARAMSKSSKARFRSVADFVAAFCGDEALEATEVQARAVDIADAVNDSDKTGATVVNRVGQGSVATARKREPSSDEADIVKASEPASGQKGMRWLALASVAAALVLGVIGTMFFMGKARESDSSASNASVVADASQAPVDSALAKLPAVDASGSETLSADAAVVAIDAGKNVKPDKGRNLPNNAKSPAYLEAQALLAKGRYRDARRFVSRDAALSKSSRGSALIVKSYCGEGNFGAAKDWLARVSRSSRKAVRKFCLSKHGIDLN